MEGRHNMEGITTTKELEGGRGKHPQQRHNHTNTPRKETNGTQTLNDATYP
jgi:hypothetical protein